MTKNKSKARTKGAYSDYKAVRFFLEDIHERIERLLYVLPNPDELANRCDMPPEPGEPDPDPQTVTGRVKGRWTVRARVNQGCHSGDH